MAQESFIVLLSELLDSSIWMLAKSSVNVSHSGTWRTSTASTMWSSVRFTSSPGCITISVIGVGVVSSVLWPSVILVAVVRFSMCMVNVTLWVPIPFSISSLWHALWGWNVFAIDNPNRKQTCDGLSDFVSTRSTEPTVSCTYLMLQYFFQKDASHLGGKWYDWMLRGGVWIWRIRVTTIIATTGPELNVIYCKHVVTAVRRVNRCGWTLFEMTQETFE